MQKLLKAELEKVFSHPKDARLINDLLRSSSFKELKAGEELNTGRGFRTLPIVIKGTLKIFRDHGRAEKKDLLLYYVQHGQSCALCIHAILKNKPNTIRAVAETKSILLLIPQKMVVSLSGRYEQFQKYLLDTLAQQFNEVSSLIDSLAFLSMEDRIRRYLHQKASLNSKRILTISHQQIADDLASSREVVSRILKQMEKKGEIKLSRGRITLVQLPKNY